MSFDAKCYVYIEVKIRPEALRFLYGRDDAPITTKCGRYQTKTEHWYLTVSILFGNLNKRVTCDGKWRKHHIQTVNHQAVSS